MNVTPLDELQWKSPEWIQVFGLRTENVLDYFAESPFFDKTSNNQVIKMQRQFSQLNDPNAAVNMTQNIMTLPDGKNGNLKRNLPMWIRQEDKSFSSILCICNWRRN